MLKTLIVFLIKAELIANLLIIIVYQAYSDPPCGGIINCTNKKYPYIFCNVDPPYNGYQETYCTNYPNDVSLFPPRFIYKIDLPICVICDASTFPDEVYMSGRGDDVKIFDEDLAIDEAILAAYNWNCLCNKQDDACQCSVKVRFTTDPWEFDYPDIDLAANVCSYWLGSCEPNCIGSEIYLNNTENFTLRRENDGRVQYFFINEEIIQDFDGDIFYGHC